MFFNWKTWTNLNVFNETNCDIMIIKLCHNWVKHLNLSYTRSQVMHTNLQNKITWLVCYTQNIKILHDTERCVDAVIKLTSNRSARFSLSATLRPVIRRLVFLPKYILSTTRDQSKRNRHSSGQRQVLPDLLLWPRDARNNSDIYL
jgi:hypothetical protein